mgnify:CR=1 FL=1
MKTKAKCVVHKIGAGAWVGYDAAGTYEAEAGTRREIERMLRDSLGPCAFVRGDDLTEAEWSKVSEADDEAEAPEEAEDPEIAADLGAPEEAEAPEAPPLQIAPEPAPPRAPPPPLLALESDEEAAKSRHHQALRRAPQAGLTGDQWRYLRLYEAHGAAAVSLPKAPAPGARKKKG